MKILVAEDDSIVRCMLENLLAKWGYTVIAALDGNNAWEILRSENALHLAILDWMMPGMEGIEICHKIQVEFPQKRIYIILLTAKNSKEDIVFGLEAGANDYIIKPFDYEELRARVQVGKRVVELETELARRLEELQKAMAHIKMLQGFLPICCYCKKIRNDQNYWQQLESYFSSNADIQFTHSICPECYNKQIKPQLDALI